MILIFGVTGDFTLPRAYKRYFGRCWWNIRASAFYEGAGRAPPIHREGG